MIVETEGEWQLLESLKKQKAIWEAFDVDYNRIREESKELARQYRRMIKAKVKEK